MVSKKRIRSFLISTHSALETLKFAEDFGKTLRAGTVVALTGEIGSGKTVFAKGLARGLGVKNPDEVKSPTFVLLHLYQGRVPIHHFDLYRLEKADELDGIGFDEFASDSKAVSIIEWAERARKRIPRDAIWIHFKITGRNSRQISVPK